jgi:hypothetical protein
MIEVFKTNISEKHLAERILDEIHKANTAYEANFDLQDCDRILRVKALFGKVNADPIINLISELGYKASILE